MLFLLLTPPTHSLTHMLTFVPHKHFCSCVCPARRTGNRVPARNTLALINNIWHRCHACTRSRGGPALYFILVISFHFSPPLFLSLLDSLLNLLDMLSSLCVGDVRFEAALNAINFPLVRHFCLILNEPSLMIGKLESLVAEMNMVIFSDIHTLLCSNLFALSDTPNIVTPQTTPRPCSAASCPMCHPDEGSHWRAISQHDLGGKSQAFNQRQRKKRPSDVGN